ncbi:MAG: hypothetical protein J6X99_08100 [Bacteroidales bacterium]|nr:hypothetical protein [Bacteroidales bacterium]
MKKLLATIFLACAGIAAMAQVEGVESNSKWDIGGSVAFTYNYNTNTPLHMSPSGFGIDLNTIEVQYHLSRTTTAALGLFDLLLDFRYLEKGYIFNEDGTVPEQVSVDGRAKAHYRDFTFSFPVSITQKFNSSWSMTLAVAPGIGLFSYNNNYVSPYGENSANHKDHFYPMNGRTGFRLDIKASVWFEDFGLTFRYRPIGSKNDSLNKVQTFAFGLTFRY